MDEVEFYDGLLRALTLVPNYHEVYATFNRHFQRLLNHLTENVQLNLVGTFAKTDYLLKEHNAEQDVVRNVNDTRVRLRSYAKIDEVELQKNCMFDLMHLSRFCSLVTSVEIPDSLTCYFPVEEQIGQTAPRLLAHSLRVIVEEWDEKYISVRCDDYRTGEVLKVSYCSQETERDFSYLNALLQKASQLNLVRPREKNGILYAEYIIFEPDYLVDVSAIASCFTEYAESPLVRLLSRFRESKTTEAILLGNFVGQLLDEQLHETSQGAYLDSVMRFFSEHAADILTADISGGFHREAQSQQRHIEKVVRETLPHDVATYDSQLGIVEPSFFCEMLGVQGRMDYLQLDLSLLMEQKSGKGEFPYDGFKHPRFRLQHYVQMLLYMAIIRYSYPEKYEENNMKLHAFLLYSKYEESLVGLSWAPELLSRAVKLRNQIAAAEISYAGGDGIKFLDTLTATEVNEKGVDGRLWQEYQLPTIESILSVVQSSSPLERAYFYRFYRFVAAEHLLSKFGNKTKENSGFASKWHDTLEEKLLSGNICCNLKLLSPEENHEGSVEEVVLQFNETGSGEMSNFRVGDIVILYPYKESGEPDVRSAIVMRCTICDITPTILRLRLRASQSSSRIFRHYEDQPWSIEHDFLESSYGSLYRGLFQFLASPQERRDLVLLQRAPRVDETRLLKGEYGLFNDLSLRVKQARDFFLIIGPPGTGKTSFGMLNTVKEELLEENSNILLMSFTNRAVDEICSKLQESNIDFLRIGVEASCPECFHAHLLCQRVKTCGDASQLRQLFLSTRVIVGTTTSLSSNVEMLRLKHFTLSVIDEASQILEPHLMTLLSAVNADGRSMIEKMVFIGDHKQLPAVVQQTQDTSRVNDALLNAIELTDCRHSLFERLFRRYHDNPSVVYMLTRQGRMHPFIAQFSNRQFYGGKLLPVPLPHQMVMPEDKRTTFIHVSPEETSPSEKVNLAEARTIAQEVFRIYQKERQHFDPHTTVGIIVPYRNQITAIRAAIDAYSVSTLRDITIDTVERFQGSQRRYIIYGFTVQYRYKLKFLTDNTFTDVDGTYVDRKLNVVLTRAQEHLILVGNEHLLSRVPLFKTLIDSLK